MNNVALANMNEFVQATPEKPILGTCSLATCIGLILSDGKTTMLAHICNDYEPIILEMLNYLEPGVIKTTIIPGYYLREERITNLKNYLNDHHIFSKYDFDIEVRDLFEYVNPKFNSIEFGYDTIKKEFIKLDFDQIIKEENDYGRN